MGGRPHVEVIRDLQRAERGDLVALLRDLEPEDWDLPSPCSDWTVADVAAHVLAWEHLVAGPTMPVRAIGSVRLLHVAARSRMNVDRINARLRSSSPREPSAIVAGLDTGEVDRWKWRFDRLSPAAQLAEYVIHHEDIRAAIRRPRTIPRDRLDLATDGVRRLPGIPAPSSVPPGLTGRDLLLHLAGR